jgi:glycosyltransferase involved in cell wall biosynthesis
MNSVPKSALAIVPCFNEEGSIAAVVSRLHAIGVCDVLVVDDGSSDRTIREARAAGAQILQLPLNLGIGGAMQAGYCFAHRAGYEYAVQVDGDGQHPPEQISKLLAILESGSADFVVGSRYLDAGRIKGRVSSLSRVLGGTVLSYWLKLLCGLRITDPTSGFRAMNRRVIALFAQEYPSDYPEPICLLMMFRRRLRVAEVSVQMEERQQGVSSIRSFRTVVYMVKVMWRMALERIFR